MQSDIFLYLGLIWAVCLLSLSFIRQFKEFRFLRSVEKVQSQQQFIFRPPYQFKVLLLIIVLSALTFAWNILPIAFQICLILFAISIILLLFEKKAYTFQNDHIQFSEKVTLVKTSDITGASITSEEVNFHTVKLINHHTFIAKKLTGKSWLEFQQAAEGFAVQHEHIKIEKI